jgi:hypothetical protein
VRLFAPRKAAACAGSSRRKLAVAYAIESVEAARKKKGAALFAACRIAEKRNFLTLAPSIFRAVAEHHVSSDALIRFRFRSGPKGLGWACGARMDLQRMRRRATLDRPDRQRLRLALAQDDISI